MSRKKVNEAKRVHRWSQLERDNELNTYTDKRREIMKKGTLEKRRLLMVLTVGVIVLLMVLHSGVVSKALGAETQKPRYWGNSKSDHDFAQRKFGVPGRWIRAW